MVQKRGLRINVKSFLTVLKLLCMTRSVLGCIPNLTHDICLYICFVQGNNFYSVKN